MFDALIAFTVALAIIFLGSCGGSISESKAADMHQGLNMITDVVDPLYEAAVIGCDSTEKVIVLRTSTREEDERDLAEVRNVCDRTFHAFEAIRQAQVVARAAVSTARAQSTQEAFAPAIEAMAALARAIENARQVWSDAKRMLRRVQQ